MTSTDSRRHDHGSARLNNPEVGHEDSDIDVGTILKFGAGLAVTVVVCAIIVWAVFRVLDRQAAARDPQISPLARPAGQLPAGAASRDERACRAREVPCGGDESARWLRLDQSARWCDAHPGGRSQEAARSARRAGAPGRGRCARRHTCFRDGRGVGRTDDRGNAGRGTSSRAGDASGAAGDPGK